MAKAKQIYFCQECGYESAKWLGQCPGCKNWNTFVEEKLVVGVGKHSGRTTEAATPTSIIQCVTFKEQKINEKIKESIQPE